MIVRTVLAPAALAALIAMPAAAQGLLGTLDQIELENGDYEMLTAASAELYTAEPPVVGSETIWANDDTRSHGTVELISHDGTCAVMGHLFRVGKTKKVYRTQSRRCRADDGTWKIATE